MAPSIDIAANTRAAQSQVKDLSTSLDAVAASLDDMASDAQHAGDQTGRSLERVERSFRDLQRASERTQDAVSADAKKAGRDIGDGYRDGVKDVQQELGQNLGETVASFRGDMSDLGQVGQDTLGGLAASMSTMGPAGAAGALGLGAVAAGVGVITESFTKASEAADEARASAFKFAYDVGGALQASGYTERLAEWTGDTEKWKQAQDIAKVAGMDVVDVVDAMASGGDKLDKLWDSFERGGFQAEVTGGRALELESALSGLRDGYASGSEAAELSARALARYAEQAGTATGKVDDLGNAIVKLPDDTEVVIDAATGKAYENVDQFEQKVRNLPNKTIGIDVDTSAIDAVYDKLNIQRFLRVNVDANVGPTLNRVWQ